MVSSKIFTRINALRSLLASASVLGFETVLGTVGYALGAYHNRDILSGLLLAWIALTLASAVFGRTVALNERAEFYFWSLVLVNTVLALACYVALSMMGVRW